MIRSVAAKYECAERVSATKSGGVAAIHAMLNELGFAKAIDARLHLLKRHLPYHESDHVLAIPLNILAGGQALQDLEDRRADDAFMDMLGAQRLPDPTTSADFLRRFSTDDIVRLMDFVNTVRADLWKRQPQSFRRDRAIIDADGTVTAVTGSKKEQMEFNHHKKAWGYHPLLISLANTREPLYIVNRPGNVPSHKGAAEYLDKAIDLVAPVFGSVLLRGDTDFSLTVNFDRWTARGVAFVFGYDAYSNVVALAAGQADSAWKPLTRASRYETDKPRSRRADSRLGYVEARGMKNLVLEREDYTEIRYRPTKCERNYRLVILRKTIRVEHGQPRLFDDDETRYFFYISNDHDLTAEAIVKHANERCDQENLIEQLKNGVRALRAPVHDLTSNWAYMVIASLAWTFKAWFGLSQTRQPERELLHTMKFSRFLNTVMLVPCQVLQSGRRLIVRVLAYTENVRLLFSDKRRCVLRAAG